jgi:hypothetical protein
MPVLMRGVEHLFWLWLKLCVWCLGQKLAWTLRWQERFRGTVWVRTRCSRVRDDRPGSASGRAVFAVYHNGRKIWDCRYGITSREPGPRHTLTENAEERDT